MRKFQTILFLSTLILSVSVFACDPDGSYTLEANPVSSGSNLYNFYFQRYCDNENYSCSEAVNLILYIKDGQKTTLPMNFFLDGWEDSNLSIGDSVSYQVAYADKDGGGYICQTSKKNF